MIDALITFQAQCRPRAPAVITARRTISFSEFAQDIDSVANALELPPVGRDEAVAVDVADAYRAWLVVLALARQGVASSHASDPGPRCRLKSEPGSAFGPPLSDDWFRKVLGSRQAGCRRPRPPPKDSLARVLCTSGTTGNRKRIGLSWRAVDSVIRNAPIVHAASQDGRWLPLTGPGNILGFAMTIGGWATGNAIILEQTIDREVFDRLRPTLIGLVPYLLRDLLECLPHDVRNDWPLRILSGGAPLPAALARETCSRLNVDLRSVYGTAETGGIAIATADLLLSRPEAAGFVVPGVEVEVLDERGVPAQAGTRGEIRVRSDRLGFYLHEEAGPTSAFRDGWFATGDLGRFSQDGVLVVEGRADDLMNLGGDKVSPAVVETALAGYTGLQELAAFSVPDALGVETCWVAFVANVSLDSAAFDEFVRVRLPWLTRLSWIQLEKLPRNQMGKIERNRLRDLARNVRPDGSGT